MALLNITFFVAADDNACEDVLVGYPVLRHLGIDSRTLMERKWASLDNTDCSIVDDRTNTDIVGRLGRLMTTRLERTGTAFNTQGPQRLSADYYDTRNDFDPFPDPCLIGPSPADMAGEDVTSSISDMLNVTINNGFP